MKDTRDYLLEQYHTHLQRKPPPAAHVTRSFERTLGPWLPESREAAILDVGCGEGALLAFLRDKGYANLSGFDVSPENVRLCQERGLGFVRRHDALDISTFSSPSDRWDVIFCMDLLEHIPKERAADFLLGLRSRLKENGCAVLQTMNMAYLCANCVRYGDPTHETGYTEASLFSLLSATGFSHIEIRPHWYATSLLGKARELYVRGMHWLIYLAEGGIAPRIASKNLLVRARSEG